MKSKTSFFSVSPAVIREDFRRFWAIPVFAFIGYFLFGILPILTRYSLIREDGGVNAMRVGSIVDNLLAGQNPFIILNSLWVPLLAGLLIFSYLHRTGSVMSVHSQPLTRNTLFSSHFLSCLLFCVLPVLLTGIVLLIIAQPIYDPMAGMHAEENLFARSRVLLWMWDYCLTSLFVLAVVIFGGMITGTSVHHFIAAVGFNVIVPAIYLILKLYYLMYLFGYNESHFQNIDDLSPAIKSVAYNPIGLKWSVIYLAVTAVIIAFSMFLYNKRKLERATDGVVFKPANVLITLLFGFLGMSLLGFAFHTIFEESQGITVFGYICGALLAMIIVRMIIMKTVRVFDKPFLKTAVAYLVAALVFFAVIVFDLTGFESRVPDPQKIDQVEITSPALNQMIASDDMQRREFREPETIALVAQLHKEIIENKEICEKGDSNYDNLIEISYCTGSRDRDRYKVKQARSYEVPASLLKESETYRKLIDSDEVRGMRENAMNLNTADRKAEILSGNIIPVNTAYDEESDPAVSINIPKEDMAEFYEVYRQEILSLDAEKLIERRWKADYAAIVLYLDVQTQGSSSPAAETREFSLKNSDTASLTWLREKGYLAQLESSIENNRSAAALSTVLLGEDGEISSFQTLIGGVLPEADKNTVIVSDPVLMRSLYDLALDYSAIALIGQENLSEYCWLVFYSKSDTEGYRECDVGFIRRADIPSGIGISAE